MHIFKVIPLRFGETQKREQLILTGKASQGKLCLLGLEEKVGLRLKQMLSDGKWSDGGGQQAHS